MTQKTTLEAWLAGRLPEDWFTGPAQVTRDRDEILIVGELSAPQVPGDDEADREVAARGRITQFREDTRERRIQIATELEQLTGRKVSWGARVGDVTQLFTTVATPVMTRLRLPERHILDTLIDAGVARSRSEALAWCVKLVGERSESWLADLRAAVERVAEVREQGPAA